MCSAYHFSLRNFTLWPRGAERCLLCFCLLFYTGVTLSRQNSDSLATFSSPGGFHKDRLRGIIFTETSGYAGSMLGVNEVWYRDFPREKFHFFNDNSEWLQADKASHIVSSYYLGKLGMDVLKWSGVSGKKSLWYGGTLGLVFLTTVEIFDGHSVGWGASWGDAAANLGGTAFLFGQEYLWSEQKILLKYSFTPTRYAPYRPELLGSNWQEQMLKDYNGMTFWVSANVASFLNKETKFPKWLNAAFGYGADGMIGGHENPAYDNSGNPYPYFNRQRQFYFSFDIDLTRIKTGSKLLNTFFNAFGFIKFPAPALELSGKKIKIHPVFF